MAITAKMVKELRDTTGAGMMDAKKALVENEGNMEAAVDWLRTKGLATAAKKAGRTAAEGLVGVVSEGGVAVAVEVNAETDFVGRNAEFQDMVRGIAKAGLGVESVEELMEADLNGKTVAAEVTDKIATIGENMSVRRLGKARGDYVASYVHNAAADGLGKIGVLVALNGSADEAAAQGIAKQVAMHVAATNPASLGQDDLDANLVEREKQVLTEQARESGKPEAVIEKMIVGRMNKFFKEVCLTEQSFVMDPDLSVAQAVAAVGDLTIGGFVRFEVGEGIEKAEDDFAAEVASMANG